MASFCAQTMIPGRVFSLSRVLNHIQPKTSAIEGATLPDIARPRAVLRRLHVCEYDYAIATDGGDCRIFQLSSQRKSFMAAKFSDIFGVRQRLSASPS